MVAKDYIYYLEKISASERNKFKNKLIEISQKLQINPNWLMVVMNSESGLKPDAVNKNGGATGLIQFMPKTAEGLGTTTEALRKMTATQQLDYVYLYFKPYTGKMKSAFDVYLVTFFPAAVGKTDSYVFETKSLSRSLIARQNPAIDLNKDGQITMGEFKKWFEKRIGVEVIKQISNPFFFWQRTSKRMKIAFAITSLGVAGIITAIVLKSQGK